MRNEEFEAQVGLCSEACRGVFGMDLVFLGSLAFTLSRVHADFLVILLQGGQILASFREFSLFHTFSDVPVDEGALGIHQVELVIQTCPCLSDGSGVGQHADGTLNLGQIASWNDSWWLIVDADLEASWTPVDELDGALGLDGGDGSVDILRDNITAVQHAAGHVLAVTWIALDHLVGGLEASVGDLGDAQLFVVGLLGADDWSVGDQWEVDTWVWDQVGLEFSQVDVEGTVETERSGDGRDNLTDQAIQVGVGWALDVQVATANVVDGFVVDHEGAIGVLQGGVGGQDRVVGFDDGG
jgi:hypothetical protein